jgi:hypothetical protein
MYEFAVLFKLSISIIISFKNSHAGDIIQNNCTRHGWCWNVWYELRL